MVVGPDPLAPATDQAEELAAAIGLAPADRTVLEAEIFPAAAAGTATLSVEVLAAPRITTDRAPAPAGTAAPPARDRGAAEALVVAVAGVVADDEGKASVLGQRIYRSTFMKSHSADRIPSKLVWGVLACVVMGAPAPIAAQQVPQAPAKTDSATAAPAPARGAKAFDTPQEAADALVAAAGKFDVSAIEEIFGPEGDDIVLSGEYPQDRQRAIDFAAEAREKQTVSLDPKRGNRAFLIVGNEDWPFPAAIVKVGGKWYFDAVSGAQELFNRRIGSNELDAIDICRGYVEAQYEYAYKVREGYDVTQYAMRIVSTPGKQDGLAWQKPDGTWEGPIGEKIAQSIEQGYTIGSEPYHGYFFKVLKGQGPAAPLGEMDYVIKGLMIGGFALVAAPAEYGETGIKTFIVSQDGVVYEKDFGPSTLAEFIKMERFNPDKSWAPVPDN